MAEHAATEVQEQPSRNKRSLLKLLLLALNVVLFLAGVGSLAWTQFGPKPVASEMARGKTILRSRKIQQHTSRLRRDMKPLRRCQLQPKPPAAMAAALARNLRVARVAAYPHPGASGAFHCQLEWGPGAALSTPRGAGGGPWRAVEGRTRKTSA